MRSNIRGIYASLLFCPLTAVASALEECGGMLADTGAPEYIGDFSHEHTFLCRDGYLLSSNLEYKVPDWVMEVVTVDNLAGRADRDRSSFLPDPDLAPGDRAELSDYRGSGFDRGHMAPAANMKWSQAAMDESFYLSNMAPQVGSGFNRGIWARLETDVRRWARRRDRLIVFTGPIYDAESFDAIGSNEVYVPTHFFKIVYEPRRRRVLAFVLPNTRLTGKRYQEFSTSVDRIEDLTGIDFLVSLSARDERRLERRVEPVWGR